jgi:RNA polymerase sigma factor (sigma-70 family)
VLFYINALRAELIHVTYEEREALKSDLADDDSESRLMNRELETVVQEEINRMPEKMKEIFLLSRNDLKTTEEIATQLNLSNQTVRNQVSSAIKRVRLAVNDYGKADIAPAALNIVITIGALMLIKY